MGILRQIKEYFVPDPSGIQLWTADPLVIANSEDEILFAGRVRVEVTPGEGATWSFRIH